MQNEIQPETSIKKTRKLAAAEAEAAAVPVTVSPVILCKILLKITAKENLHIIWLKSYTHLLWRQRQQQLCSTLWENELKKFAKIKSAAAAVGKAASCEA